MDINCGAVLDESESVSESSENIFWHIRATASGASTKSEALGFGDAEFTPWVLGAMM